MGQRMMDRFLLREEYKEKVQVFKAQQPNNNKYYVIKKWVFYYSDGTEESLMMKIDFSNCHSGLTYDGAVKAYSGLIC